MTQKIKVLDRGFIRMVESMGGDAGVVQAARVSLGQGLKGEEKDRRLIHYLLHHGHMTPFEHAVFKFHIKLPLFVMRQWIRHRMASYNEKSARYAEVSDEFYVPGIFRVQDPANKQGSVESRAIDQARARRILRRAQAGSFSAYRELLDAGVAREMARLALPVSLYTQFYWTVNARSLMHFIGLRADSSAQWEMRRYAEGLAVFFRQKMPWTWEAFLRYTWEGANPVLDGQKRLLETALKRKP